VSAAKKTDAKQSWDLTGSWAGAWKIFAGIGALGLAGAAAGFAMDPRRFAFSWLFAFMTCLAIALGATFFVLIQHLTSAGWSVTVRRTAEFFSNGLLVMAPLFIPVLLTMGHLFPWLSHEGHGGGASTPGAIGAISLVKEAHAQDRANIPPSGHGSNDGQIDRGADPKSGQGAAEGRPSDTPGNPAGEQPGMDHNGIVPGHGAAVGHGGSAAPAHGGAEHALHEAHGQIHHATMGAKSGWLNKGFFLARVGIYFVIWALLAIRLFGFSTAQDSSKDPKLTLRAAKFAPGATMLFALSLTFAAFDWIMSLEPSWFSTIFGVYYFASGVVSSLATIILVTMALRTSGPLSGAVTVEHYHDLGKLMFGFLVFWAYIGFSQFMLIWYAALPEETTFFHNRWDFGPWSKVSLALIIGHFVIPFFWTISRNFKRNLGRLQIGAAMVFVMHIVDVYWLVMPNYALGKDTFSFHWMDAACLLAVAGIYVAFVFFRMTKFPLVPIGDPRLQRSLHFQNA